MLYCDVAVNAVRCTDFNTSEITNLIEMKMIQMENTHNYRQKVVKIHLHS